MMKKYLILCFIGYLLGSCVEPFEFKTRDADSILVVQANITDMLERQVVILSRAANLENVNIESPDSLNVNVPFISTGQERVNPEMGATVILVDEFGDIFSFVDQGDGIYESEEIFSLNVGVQYQLQIITANAETYESDFKSLAGKSEIGNMYAERGFNGSGEEGITIFADGSDATGTSNYFRYSYVDTYKIIAPNANSLELEVIEGTEDGFPDVRVVERTQEEQVCYNSESSKDINLVSTITLSSPIVEKEVVRFINRNNPIISHRYSILLKQFVIDNEAYNYYQKLIDFSQSESVFSEIQPGFLEGNIRRTDISNGLVLGYFEVASVAEKRFFFNFQDFFPNEELPPYFGDTNCDRLIAPALGNPNRDGPQPLGCPAPSLISDINNQVVEFIGVNTTPGECEGPYLMTSRICGDCTALGSNVKPDFWID